MNTARLAFCAALAFAYGGCAQSGSIPRASSARTGTRTDVTSQSSDHRLAELLVGTWQEMDPKTKHVALEISYAAEGKQTGWFWDHVKTGDVKVTVDARWEVVDGRIRVTSCVTAPAGRLPSSYSAEIISMGAEEMVLRSPDDGVLHRRLRSAKRGSPPRRVAAPIPSGPLTK